MALICRVAEQAQCGKTCCCYECEEKATCNDLCYELSSSGSMPNCKNIIHIQDELVTLDAVTAPAIIQTITDMVVQQKKMEEQITSMREQIRLAMEQHGIKSFENDKIKMTYIAPTERKSVDTTKLKKEHPEIAEAYQKVSQVKSTVKIEVK